ncbi:cation/H(+) antiporter 4-like [Cornus florida]|uniref:cation/H(+) antiporter 4-like n=1 Tax=Cornus florida TaxID=4283 RepID=UPI002898AF14|nr:cation/H(+) antiporter 4-like [Cornus florida]
MPLFSNKKQGWYNTRTNCFRSTPPSVEDALCPEEGGVLVKMLTKLGYMFLMGVNMDTRMVLKYGDKAWAIAIFSIVIPLGYTLIISEMVLAKVADKSMIGPFADRANAISTHIFTAEQHPSGNTCSLLCISMLREDQSEMSPPIEEDQTKTMPGPNKDYCVAEILPLHSPGIFNLPKNRSFNTYALPELHLQLAMIFIVTQSTHMVLKRFNVSRTVSEILAGIILGESFLGSIPGFNETFFPVLSTVYLDLVAKTGYILFMFLIGVKMEPSMMMRTGKKVWTLALSSVIIPILAGIFFSSKLTYTDFSVIPTINNVILTQTFSPFPVIACLLNDLKIINSELGRLALATALIRELLSLAIHTPLNYTRVSALVGSLVTGGLTLALFLIFIISIVFFLRPVFLWIIRQTPEGKPVDELYITFISCGVLLSAIISDFLGAQMYHVGPLILGLAIPVGPPLGSTLEERFDTFVTGFFTPVLMTLCGMKTNFHSVINLFVMKMLLTVCAVGTIINFIGIFLPSLTWKMPLKDATTLSLILSSQGIVEMAGLLSLTQNQLSSYSTRLITLSLSLSQIEAQTINREAFSIVTLIVLLAALIVPWLVRHLYDFSRIYIGYQKRNILQSPVNAEMRIFVCIHRQDEALAAIKLLEVSNPTRESPLHVHVLHLMELKGRATPVLINHKFGQKISAVSRSRQIIDIFNYYENQFLGLVHVQAFTAISMPKFMHYDICTLAFDKLTSLVILPFHRKWNSQGKMIVDNNTLRSINHQVMELAPCSVGILVDRRKIQRTTPVSPLYRVAVLFLGGDDDREALAYAKRMAQSPAVHLTVMRLVAEVNMGEDNWETMLDAENLKDIRLQSSPRGNVMYREEKVRDGPGTALVIRTMEEICDLIMVGRRHRLDSPVLSGLLEWTELPELGAIGDLLASPDTSQPVSILVVQQQQTKFKAK